MDVIEDIKRNNYNFDCNHDLYTALSNDLEDYDYEKDWVNAPAAFGDTHKFTCTYTIKGTEFVYWHICAEGEIGSAEFTIDGEIVMQYSMMAAMMKRIPEPNLAPLEEFIQEYDPDVSTYDYLGVLTLLNEFTFGHCFTVWNGEVVYTELQLRDLKEELAEQIPEMIPGEFDNNPKLLTKMVQMMTEYGFHKTPGPTLSIRYNISGFHFKYVFTVEDGDPIETKYTVNDKLIFQWSATEKNKINIDTLNEFVECFDKNLNSTATQKEYLKALTIINAIPLNGCTTVSDNDFVWFGAR